MTRATPIYNKIEQCDIPDLVQPGDWIEQAACRSFTPQEINDHWWNESNKGIPTEVAQATCFSCPIQKECLNLAIVNDERYGIWGGLSYRQRKAITSRRRRYQCPVCLVKKVSTYGTYQECDRCFYSWDIALESSDHDRGVNDCHSVSCR